MKTKNDSEQTVSTDIVFHSANFPNIDAIIAAFEQQEFKERSPRKRFHRVNQVLLQLIQEAPDHSFLLPAVVDYIEKVKNLNILNERYHISQFELWLNLFSDITEEQNYLVRAKVIGKLVPRESYQSFFPIGMDKTFNGTHFVAAHLSPDVDTMIASFWGWVDAFGARVGDARHLWSLPGGPPDAPTTKIFTQLFGDGVFANLSTSTPSLSLSTVDLVTQKGMAKKKGDVSISSIDFTTDKAVILVDENGHFLGDWHSADIEPIRKIIIRFKSCLRWFENNLHVKLISLFAKKNLHVDDLPVFFSSIFDVKISDCEPAKEFTGRQLKDLNDFFIKVLGLQNGLYSTFRQLNQALKELTVFELSEFQDEVEAIKQSSLFDSSGYLKEDRPAIFHYLEKLINQLDHSIHHVRDYAEQLDVALNIKSKVFGISSQVITTRNDVEDIRIKIQKKDYLTVVIPDSDHKIFPIGIVWANSVNKSTLGTVSFRDFSNEEEVKMANYLTPISVIDHHKANLKTSTPPLIIIGDAQSCNVLIAEQAFKINDLYSLNGMTLESIQAQIEQEQRKEPTLSHARILARLIQKKTIAQSVGKYFVNPERELAEYLFFLYAILDDTDLLTKVTNRDVECVVELLNRIKSLALKQEVEVVNLDGIAQDKNFAKMAAKRILRHPDMYSIYYKIYRSKELEVNHNLSQCRSDHCEYFFADTKEQNGCCRVGQSKLFSSNFAAFKQCAPQLMKYWLEKSRTINKEKPQIDFYLHMISTVASAEDIFEDKIGHYQHKDQLWFWMPSTQKGYDHLTNFLTAFLSAQRLPGASFEFLPGLSEDAQQVFLRNGGNTPVVKMENGPNLPIAIIHFDAGTLNSRKAMITPYLPKI